MPWYGDTEVQSWLTFMTLFAAPYNDNSVTFSTSNKRPHHFKGGLKTVVLLP